MSDPVLGSSSRIIANLVLDMRNVANINRFMAMDGRSSVLTRMMANSQFRRAFEMWQEAAR